MYAKFFKRMLDFILSLIAMIIFSPILLGLIVVGAVAMKGNPFFIQARPGRINKKNGKERIFNLVKFRTMSNAKDERGMLLPDDERLGKYGMFLRNTSLDELPELWNVFKGDMSIVGPRPLLPQYLPYYTEAEHRRHDVRPGLTGLAQVNGRNTVSWEKRFELDVQYRNNITFLGDVKILIDTVKSVFSHENISLNALENFDEYRKKQICKSDSNTKVGPDE